MPPGARIVSVLSTFAGTCLAAAPPPLGRTLDLRLGESERATLQDGRVVEVRLVSTSATKDSVRGAVRSAEVEVDVDGHKATLGCGAYRLPVVLGPVQIDCPVTAAVYAKTDRDAWALEKDARLRLWPVGSPWAAPGTFAYPIRQRLFTTLTQATGEPTYVDGGESARRPKVYYHAGLDMGGAEGMVDALAAADGLVICRGREVLPEFRDNAAVEPEDNALFILDSRGWIHRYFHMLSLVPSASVGSRVRMGETLGQLGKEGGSGGWAHLHYDIKALQPSGRWGTEDPYAYVFEAYRNEVHPRLIALARPHHLAVPGEEVLLDGTRSWSSRGSIVRYDWTFTDGTTASGPTPRRSYSRPGEYAEMLKVTDAAGEVAYDVAIVLVNEPPSPEGPERLPPTIHPAYFPTRGVKAGEAVTFLVRSFLATEGEEAWDFGEGSPATTVKSDGNVDAHAKDGYARTVHRYSKPGTYVVKVERANSRGERATGRLAVTIEP